MLLGIRTAEQAFFVAASAPVDRAVRIWPGFAGGYYRRGPDPRARASQYQQAIVDLTKATELHPEWPEPYLQRGLFQRFHGDPQAAIADLQRFLELGGDRSWRGEAERQIATLRGGTGRARSQEPGARSLALFVLYVLRFIRLRLTHHG